MSSRAEFGFRSCAARWSAVDGKGAIMKTFARYIVLSIAVLILAPGLFWARQTAPGLAGTWSGKTTKHEGPKSSATNVIFILDGSGAGFIEYPKLKCGGTLHLVRKNGDTLSYQETITHGKANCSEDGRVDVVPDGNALAWTWSAGQNKATATLTASQASSALGCVECDVNYDNELQACYRMTNSADQQKCQNNADDDLRICQTSCKD